MQKYSSSQSREYDQGVVEVLKEELMGTTKDFRKVLEVRHENLQETDKRRQRFGGSAPDMLGKPIIYKSRNVGLADLFSADNPGGSRRREAAAHLIEHPGRRRVGSSLEEGVPLVLHSNERCDRERLFARAGAGGAGH